MITYCSDFGEEENIEVEVRICKECVHFGGKDAYQGEDVILCKCEEHAKELDRWCDIKFKTDEFKESGNIAIIEPYALGYACQSYKEKE